MNLYRTSKRLFDLLAAALGLVALSPVMLVLYLLVRAGGGGPGFFVQDRAGLGGKLFPLVKFRTMKASHAHNPDPTIVITDADADVTPVGRFLRRTKLDELPQLFNVLAGQMSLVGPRPTVPEQIADYTAFQRRRLEVPPGVTGLAQVHGGTALTWPERIEWDVYYVDHRSWGMDARILLATLAALFRGAEKRVQRLQDYLRQEK
jgi:lipopolysaccharide/colanic/teichoic acid biosynthesis glycosyltransferase